MIVPAPAYLKPEEYLAMEVRALDRNEYFDGRIYAMAGAGLNHNFIVSELLRMIGNHLEGKNCEVMVADLRITSPASDSYMYPDLTVICGDIETQEKGFDTVTNPSVIIEVMSASTRGFDMAFKFYYYKQIPSLKEYILVDSTRPFVQINRRRDESSWEDAMDIIEENGSFTINTIGLSLRFADVYRKASFS